VFVQIGRDQELKNKQFYPDPELSEIVIDDYQRQMNADLNIDALTTEVLTFGDVDAVKGIFLEVDQDAKVYLNGSLDAIQLRIAGDTLVTKAKLFLEADISSVSVENTHATNPLTGVYCVWGDPSA
jgi:hypothetical protein